MCPVMKDYNGHIDEQLAALLREGDDCAFTEIYNRYWKLLLTPEELYEHTELRNKIYQVASRMPDKCREVFWMSRFEQLSQQEIAERLDISVSTAQKHITKELSIMKTKFAAHQYQIAAVAMALLLKK